MHSIDFVFANLIMKRVHEFADNKPDKAFLQPALRCVWALFEDILQFYNLLNIWNEGGKYSLLRS